MKYSVFINKNQEKEIDALKEFHKSIEKADDFNGLLISFVEENRKNQELIKNPVMGRDIFLSSIRQIIYSFKKLKEIEGVFSGHKNERGENIRDVRNAMILVFFINSKFFLEMVKKHNMIIRDEDFEQLWDSITSIRNYLVHAYEKNFYENQKAIIRLDPNQHFNEDLYILQIYDINTGNSVGEVNFSLDVFYYKLRNIFKKLKDSAFSN